MNNVNLVDVIKLSKELCAFPIRGELAYATNENFLGRIVSGYHPEAADICLLAPLAANALCSVQNELNKQQIGLFVFDGYRPLRAVKDFGKWMHEPVETQESQRKMIHYPHIEKHQLASLGCVCDTVSNHCFGDTIDLALLDLATGKLLDMGTCFDFFDELSYPSATADLIGEQAFHHRKILSDAMQAAGFLPFHTEYWHFTYHKREISTPLDVEISPTLASLIAS